MPVHRVVEILTSLTGAAPSAGFVHSLLRRAARALAACDFAIRTLITLAFAVCADETPLKVGPAAPAEGKKEAKGYLHVACTDLYTHFLLGDRSMRRSARPCCPTSNPTRSPSTTATRTTTAPSWAT